MKKIIALLFCVICFSCDDGDFDLPAFDFAETVYDCDLIGNEYVLFRLSEAESLIVTLTTNQIKDEVTDEPILAPITESNVIYRSFDSEISPSYFCESVPPITPVVLSNWTGVAGSSSNISIETIEELDDDDIVIGYRHDITFENLKLQNGENYIIYQEDYFGYFITYL